MFIGAGKAAVLNAARFNYVIVYEVMNGEVIRQAIK